MFKHQSLNLCKDYGCSLLVLHRKTPVNFDIPWEAGKESTVGMLEGDVHVSQNG
jgi:hypothetical protein